MEILDSPFGEFRLNRYPLRQRETLRAWDAADELLLAYLAEQFPEGFAGASILLVNDAFGALAMALSGDRPSSWGDSYLGQLASQHNYQANGVTVAPALLASTEVPQPPTKPHWDIVLVKVPKTLALLEQQLASVRPFINSNTLVVAGGMVKYIHNSTSAAFEKWLGPTTTSLARKKARLVFPNFADSLTLPSADGSTVVFEVPEWQLSLSNQANVFSREKLDIGARFFLEQFRKLPKAKHIVDLGCGNGVLGCVAQRLQPDAKVTFVDESFMALASAKQNYQRMERPDFDKQAQFLIGNGLQQLAGVSDDGQTAAWQDAVAGCDLVLCNPPFHQQHSIGDHIAWQMFNDSATNLAKGGELWVVGNRHLGYHVKLKKLFSQVEMVASNNKFVVIKAIK